MRKLIIIATTLVPAAAFAGGYNIPDENARTLGLSQANLADETGAEAVITNPAALAGPLGLDISASLEALDNRTDWSDPTLGSAKLVSHVNTPPLVAVSYGDVLSNGMKWGVGLGFGVPAGGSLKWPDGWQGKEYIQSVDQKVYQFVAGAAFQPVPYLKIGATYVRYQGEEELHQALNFLDHYGDADLGMSGGANSFDVAAEVKIPTIPLKLAGNYRYKGSTQIDGNVHFSDVPPAYQTLLQDQAVHEQLTLPSEFEIGAAYSVVPNLTVMGTFTYENWSVYHTDTFVGDGGFQVVVPRNYNNAQVYRLGVEWDHVPFLSQLTLRVGTLRSISPQPTDTVSPSLTDGNSWAVSAGVGYDVMPSLRIDVGYQHAIFDNVVATGTETFPGTYKTQVDLVSLGVNWRIDLLGHGK